MIKPNKDLLALAQVVIESIQSDPGGHLTDEALSKLAFIFPTELIIAALDLIDRGNVIHYKTPWGYSEYEVLGSAAKYSVLVDISAAPIPYSCTCPAFAYLVLLSRTHIMCKHVLATLIGRKLSLCIDRPANADDLATIYCRLYPLHTKGVGIGDENAIP